MHHMQGKFTIQPISDRFNQQLHCHNCLWAVDSIEYGISKRCNRREATRFGHIVNPRQFCHGYEGDKIHKHTPILRKIRGIRQVRKL
jgi:hypothetical protein